MAVSVFRPVDAAPLSAFRAVFGALMLVHVARLHFHGMYWRSVVAPPFHFTLSGVQLPVPSTPRAAYTHLMFLALSAAGLALGMWPRLCASAFATAYAYFVLCERTMFNNHFYLYAIFAALLVLIGGPSRRASTLCWWQRALLRAQLALVYAYAAVAKLNEDWLVPGEPMATKLASESALHEPGMRWTLDAMPALPLLVSWAGVAVDGLAPPLLLCNRTRPIGIALTCAFHVGNAALWRLGDFPWVMLATSLIFLDALPGGSAPPRPPPPPPGRPQLARLAAGVAHLLVQLLLPLRPLVLAGFDPLDAVHTKAHTLLSWRFMAVSTRNFFNFSLRSTRLGATFVMTRTLNRLHLVHPDGTARPLPLAPPLHSRQAGYMPYSAPMLATFARAAAERHPGYAVRGELWSSINGRPLQRFVDAAADLSAVEVSALSRPPWVRTLLRRFGSPVWRARLRMLRTRIRAAGHAAVIFADAPGGVRMHAEELRGTALFPVRALLVPLAGTLRVTTPAGAAELAPPAWSEAPDGQPELRPRAAPAELPLGEAHRVRTTGSEPSCWAYVFGERPAAS